MEEGFGLLRNAFKDSNITGEQISCILQLTENWFYFPNLGFYFPSTLLAAFWRILFFDIISFN